MSLNHPITLDLMRHGEPEGGSRFRGSGVDDPLSPRGWAQVRAASAGCAEYDLIASSPMRRCRPFAEELAATLNAPLRVETGLREIGLGVWEGLGRREIGEAALARFYADPEAHYPEGGEPLPAFNARVATALDAVLASVQAGEPAVEGMEQRVLLVAHSGVLRAVAVALLGLPTAAAWALSTDYAHVARFRTWPEGWKLTGWNLPRLQPMELP